MCGEDRNAPSSLPPRRSDPNFRARGGTFRVRTSPQRMAREPRTSKRFAHLLCATGYAFGVKLSRCEHQSETYRARTGPISIPSDLDGIIEGVFGLDNRPQAKPHF